MTARYRGGTVKQAMKRIIGIILTLLALSVMLSGCTRVLERPDDTNLEFWITEDVTGFDFSDHHFIPGWMGAWEYYGKDYAPVTETTEGRPIHPEHYVTYVVSCYPDESSNSVHITQIEITDPAVTFYGISLESTEEEIAAAMEKHGFQLVDKNASGSFFEDGNIEFRFHSGKIVIRAESTNKLGIMY